jgi:light-regulated signal transduction histidine kinase (bacteriophytochrome)
MAQSIFEKYNPEEARPLAHSFPYIQKIIQSHGGQAFVRPEYKEGLSFVFTLPETTESEI